MVADLDHNKRLYKDSVEENGRLEARIQAFAINAQSEQDVLSGEVKRREETIARLKMEAMNLNEVNSRCEEKVHSAFGHGIFSFIYQRKLMFYPTSFNK